MVNVNKHEIFPTVVYQFNCGFDDLSQLDITQMSAYILSNENEDIVHQSKDGLQLLSTFQNLHELEEWDKEYINQNKMVIRFECRAVKVSDI